MAIPKISGLTPLNFLLLGHTQSVICPVVKIAVADENFTDMPVDFSKTYASLYDEAAKPLSMVLVDILNNY